MKLLISIWLNTCYQNVTINTSKTRGISSLCWNLFEKNWIQQRRNLHNSGTELLRVDISKLSTNSEIVLPHSWITCTFWFNHHYMAVMIIFLIYGVRDSMETYFLSSSGLVRIFIGSRQLPWISRHTYRSCWSQLLMWYNCFALHDWRALKQQSHWLRQL